MLTPISVIIPTWNRRRQVTDLVRRLLARQRSSDFECIVVDDGSTDGTDVSLGRLAQSDDRLLVVRQDHAGVSIARNLGAAHAVGTWLVFLDSDDEPDDDWIATYRSLLWTGVDLAFTGQRRRSPDGTISFREPTDPGLAFGNIVGLWQAGSFAVSAELFATVGGYQPGLSFSENTDLALRVAQHHELFPVLSVFDPSPHITVNIRPDRYEAARRYASAVHILDRHRRRLQKQPVLLATYEAMAGVAAERLGERAEASMHLRRAVRANPIDLRHTARLVRASTRPARR